MKDELQGKLVEILTSIQTAAGKASDFAMEQLPDIAQSYIVYGRVTATVTLIVLIAFAIASAWVAAKHGFLSEKLEYGMWTVDRVFAALFGSIGAVLLSLGALASFGSFALVWFAPKVWLLKELAALVK